MANLAAEAEGAGHGPRIDDQAGAATMFGQRAQVGLVGDQHAVRCPDCLEGEDDSAIRAQADER